MIKQRIRIRISIRFALSKGVTQTSIGPLAFSCDAKNRDAKGKREIFQYIQYIRFK